MISIIKAMTYFSYFFHGNLKNLSFNYHSNYSTFFNFKIKKKKLELEQLRK